MQPRRFITIALCSIALGGCALGGAATPPQTYDLLAPKVMTLTAPNPAKFQLVVNEPNAVRSLDTDRILVKPDPTKVAYYKGAAWSDRLPSLMQSRIVEAFQNAGLVSAVGSRSDRLNADLVLATEVRAFQVDVGKDGQAKAHASLYVKVIDGEKGRMIASRAFETQVDTSATDVNAMVTDLNQAFDKTLREIVPWVAARKDA